MSSNFFSLSLSLSLNLFFLSPPDVLIDKAATTPTTRSLFSPTESLFIDLLAEVSNLRDEFVAVYGPYAAFYVCRTVRGSLTRYISLQASLAASSFGELIRPWTNLIYRGQLMKQIS